MKDFISSKGERTRRPATPRGGRARKPTTPKGAAATRKLAKSIAAIAALAVIALGVWWWVGRDEARPSTPDTRQLVPPKASTGREPQPTSRESRPTSHESRATNQEPRTALSPQTIRPQSTSLPTTNLDAQTIYDKIASRYTTNSAVRPLDPNDPDLPVKTGVYQEIGSLMSGELGDPVAPFPYSFQVDSAGDQNDQFLASLKHKIELKDDDTVTSAERKRKTLQARLDLLDAIDAGLTVKDALKEAYIQRVRAYEARQAYVADLREYAEENPTSSDFNKVLEDVNAKLGERGIKKIQREDLGLEDLQD